MKKEKTTRPKEEAAKKKEKTVKRKEEAAKRKQEAARKKREAAKKKLSKNRDHTRVTSNDEDDDDGLAHPSRSAARINKSGLIENNNQCFVCFRMYEEDQHEETGFQWVKCACQRWVHEDCYSEVFDRQAWKRTNMSLLCYIVVIVLLLLCMVHVKICYLVIFL